MLFRQLFDRESCTYTYILADDTSPLREALIIDPVLELFDRDSKLIQELNLSLLYSIETHVHADHITGGSKLQEKTGCKLVSAEGSGVRRADIFVKENDQLMFGSRYVRFLSTPGHTSSCLTVVTDDRKKAFTGDTLFVRGCGRTDFQGGSSDLLFESITQKIYRLDDDCLIYPAHDYKGCLHTSVAEEKKFNPRIFLGQTKEKFIEIMGGLNLPKPGKIDLAVPKNLNGGYD